MAASELNCPNCGAPLQVENSESATTRCSFCNSVVLLPDELHPPPRLEVQVVGLSSTPPRPVAPVGKVVTTSFAFIIVAFLLLLGFAVPAIISGVQKAQLAQALQVEQTATLQALIATQTAAPTQTPPPTLTPTPQYASPVLTFGGEGIGEGLFNNAGHIALDGQGNVYVADYVGGRIQRFDTQGRYLPQCRVGNRQTFIHGLSATYAGQVFVAHEQVIDQYDGATGKAVNQLTHPDGGEFGSLAATADGNLAAVWYEGRWGLITSLEGHREELVIFNGDGQIIRQFPNFISTQTEALALDVNLVVDGAGTIFALSDGVIFKFSPEGKFLDQINALGDQEGQFISANSLAIDGQGRMYVVDGRQISVYEANQRFIDRFDSPEYLNSVVLDRSGGIWGAADDRVIHFTLR